MPEYELKYLNLRGRGEPIRMMLHHLQIPFKDTAIDRINEWSKVKNSMPFKQVPVFIVDGKFVLAQTTVILRYLAKKHGLEANSLEDQALCDMYAEYIQDFIFNIRPFIWTITRNQLDEKEDKFINIFLPQVTENFGPIFETQLKRNGSGYLIGNGLTWVDFMLAEWSDKIVTYGKADVLNGFPLVLAHKNNILALPHVRTYLKTRLTSIF